MNASKELEHILRRRRERADVEPNHAKSSPSNTPSNHRTPKQQIPHVQPHPQAHLNPSLPPPHLSTFSRMLNPSSRIKSPRHPSLPPPSPSPSTSSTASASNTPSYPFPRTTHNRSSSPSSPLPPKRSSSPSSTNSPDIQRFKKIPPWAAQPPPPPPPPGPPPPKGKRIMKKVSTKDSAFARKRNVFLESLQTPPRNRNTSYVSDDDDESQDEHSSKSDEGSKNSTEESKNDQIQSPPRIEMQSNKTNIQMVPLNNTESPTQNNTNSKFSIISSPLRKALTISQSEPLPSENISYNSTMQFQSHPIPIFHSSSAPPPVLNPLTGNLICIRQTNRHSFHTSKSTNEPKVHPTIIEEINPCNGSVHASTNICAVEFLHECSKVQSSNIHPPPYILGISKVLSLTSALYRPEHKYRIKVACVLEILYSSRDTKHVVAIWNWGSSYSTRMLSLQCILPPPTLFIRPTTLKNHSVSYYDPTLLQITPTGLVIVGGSQIHTKTANKVQVKERKACLFIISIGMHKKPTWKTVSISNVLIKSENVTALAVLPLTNQKLVAVATDNGSVSLWNYDAGTSSSHRLSTATSSSGSSKIHPIQYICSFQGSSALENADDTMFVNADVSEQKSPPKSSRYCMNLSWITPHTSSNRMPFSLLAASFQDGILTYILPPDVDALPFRKYNLAPMALIKTCLHATISRVSWVDLGATSPPGIMGLFQFPTNVSHSKTKVLPIKTDTFSSRLFLGSLNLPPLHKETLSDSYSYKENPIGISTYCEGFSTNDPNGPISSFLYAPTISSIVCQYESGLTLHTVVPSYSKRVLTNSVTNVVPQFSSNNLFSTRRFGISSASLGLDSRGFPLLYPNTYSPTTANDDDDDVKREEGMINQDGIYHIFTQFLSLRMSTDHQSTASNVQNQSILEWGPPTRRFWLCRTVMGDHKKHHSFEQKMGEEHDEHDGEEDLVRRGARTSILCELSCVHSNVHLTPQRIIKDAMASLVCVLFSPLVGDMESLEGTKDDNAILSPYPISFGIYPISSVERKPKNLESYPGRDIVFLPKIDYLSTNVLVLNCDGSTIAIRSNQMTQEGVSTWIPQNDAPIPISSKVHGSERLEDTDWCRIFPLSYSNSFQIIFVGKILSNDTVILATGSKINYDSFNTKISQWPMALLPPEDALSLSLPYDEHVLNIIPLPDPIGNSSPCFAVATQLRVLIVTNETLEIKASVFTKLTSNALSPLGSHCVAFSSSELGNGSKIRYLSCLEKEHGQGVIASLPNPRFGNVSTLLLALQPDRFLYLTSHSTCRMMEALDEHDQIRVPIPITNPAFLLEPMIANALCEYKSDGFDLSESFEMQLLLREIIDRFGRRNSSFPHAPNEGIGLEGVGITTKVLEMLNAYGCFQAASFLLTGNASSEPATPNRILPPWIPIQVKVQAAALGRDARQVLMAGNSNLMDYVTYPEYDKHETLLGSSAPSSILSGELGLSAMRNGKIREAISYFDLAGSPFSERLLSELAISTQLEPNSESEFILNAILGNSKKNMYEEENGVLSSCEAISALVLDLRQRKNNNAISRKEGECDRADNFVLNSMKYLAPSLRIGGHRRRIRDQLMDIGGLHESRLSKPKHDQVWIAPQKDIHHVWHRGPFDDKEELLLLDKMDEWLGRRQPTIVGKDGVAIAQETGQKVLADILLAAARDENEENKSMDSGPDVGERSRKNWIEGIGEGREDEENLSLYFRFSEGDSDEDNNWTTEGILDLTKHAHRAIVFGNECACLEPTSSSVDEGETGKIKLLYDLVFNETFGFNSIAGLAVEVKRGDSLDVGIMHGYHSSRQRCSTELWYYLPIEENGNLETVLARRSLNLGDKDLSKLCCASNSVHILWELVLLPTGQLQFRTSGGSVVTTGNSDPSKKDEFSDTGFDQLGDEDIEEGTVSWRKDDRGGWNHVCMVFSPSLEQDVTRFNVNIFMKSVQIISTEVNISLPSFDSNMYSDFDAIDDVMNRSVLLFGLSPIEGFRMTEIRVWSCARSEDDIKLMMYEYLKPAEVRKKFKVKIRKKRNTPIKNIALLPSPSKVGRLSKLPQPAHSRADRNKKSRMKLTQETLNKQGIQPTGDFLEFNENPFDFGSSFNGLSTKEIFQIPADPDLENDTNVPFNTEFEQLVTSESNNDVMFPEFTKDITAENPIVPFDNFNDSALASNFNNSNFDIDSSFLPTDTNTTETSILNDSASSTSVTSLLFEVSSKFLSQEVRKGAASAIIRGPPATRHFGGNRGGLITGFKNWKRKKGLRRKASSIAICGTDKTVIYSYGEDPTGVTFPLGASGAIMSDILDNKEYICCYTVQDKKLNVYDIKNNSPVMGLQMPTKLNYWRFLPSETHCNTLVILLITPIGGFHWMPIGKNPQPKLIWRRNSHLQRKKILSYEEGGCNGAIDSRARSTVALILTTSATPHQAPIEAWCIPFAENAKSFCVSTGKTLGAAFMCPSKLENRKLSFIPMIVLVIYHTDNTTGKDSTILQISRLLKQDSIIKQHEEVINIPLDVEKSMLQKLPEPVMATGSYPPVFILSLEHVIVVVFRSIGLILAFLYDGIGPTTKLGRKTIDHYIVDASIHRGDVKGEIQVILLLSLPDGKDGFVAEIQVSQVGVMC